MKMEPPAHFLTPRLNSSFRLFLAPRNILALIPSEGRVKTGATGMTTWPRGPGKKAWPISRCFCLHARHSARIRAACTQFLCSRGLSVAAARYFHHPSAVDSYYWTLGRRGRVPVGIQVSNSRLTVVLRSQVLDRGDRLRLLWILTQRPSTGLPHRLLQPRACNYRGPDFGTVPPSKNTSNKRQTKLYIRFALFYLLSQIFW